MVTTRLDNESKVIYYMIIERFFKRPFIQFVKKAHKPLQLMIEDVVELICADPQCGELKVGDLSGVRVYKFSFNRSQYLVAYQLTGSMDQAVFLAIEFIQIGSHEKFYESLKKYLREIKG